MKNSLLAAVMLLLSVACGAYRFPSGDHSAGGTVSGKVVAVPCAPVESPDITCANRPAADLEIDFNAGGTSITTTTDSNGGFTVELPAATYKVAFKPPTRILSGPASIAVQPNASLHANYVVDSGIRIPLPNQ